MCKIMEDLIREQREYSDSVMLVQIIEALSETLNIPTEKACELTKRDYTEYQAAKTFLENVNAEDYEFEYA